MEGKGEGFVKLGSKFKGANVTPAVAQSYFDGSESCMRGANRDFIGAPGVKLCTDKSSWHNAWARGGLTSSRVILAPQK